MSPVTSPPTITPAVVTRADAAKYLAISIRLLDKLTAARQLRCVKIGRAIRFRTGDLDAFLQSRASA
jgi:excisionase family DNA binding protein